MHDMYIWLDTTAQAVTLGGIPFAAFYACAKPYIRNMLLLKSDYVGAHCCKNFELLCGQDEIKAFLASEDLRFGDFCFVDFADGANPDALTPEQVAELLYVAHMWSPLRGIDFPPLRNAFIYLSHDGCAHTETLLHKPCRRAGCAAPAGAILTFAKWGSADAGVPGSNGGCPYGIAANRRFGARR